MNIAQKPVPSKDWRFLSFVTPIEAKETVQEGATGNLVVKGVAINAIKTRNGHTFRAEELRKSASSLKGKPILTDHNNSVDAIAGRTTEASFDEANQRVVFEGVIRSQKYADMIREGLITAVSVGAMVDDIEYEMNADGSEVTGVALIGLEFVEVSLVAIPADPNAGFSAAVEASLDLKEKMFLKQIEPNIPYPSPAAPVKEAAKEKIIMENPKQPVPPSGIEPPKPEATYDAAAINELKDTVAALSGQLSEMKAKAIIARADENEGRGVVTPVTTPQESPFSAPLAFEKASNGGVSMYLRTFAGTTYKNFQRPNKSIAESMLRGN